ncbi:hypothetical protein [Arsenophonus nasoniae]|uniref:Uncharacterized protein n=1 Tax=Arsenophonus nasoniae TaxID=638 RepID=A0AA95GP06_9GAMM|nr:hypothetical protein [Arsenophonus nasoniae]WGM02083.1 hypothetical protein QE210_02905 [Arsenophonus nasoniae]
MLFLTYVSDLISRQTPVLPHRYYCSVWSLVSYYSLSLRELEKITAKRGIIVDAYKPVSLGYQALMQQNQN